MTVFVDTSFLFALINKDDSNYRKAHEEWNKFISKRYSLVTSNYIIVETCALLKNRLGKVSVEAFVNKILPCIKIIWIGKEMHTISLNQSINFGKNGPSLVDCSSFEIMKRNSIDYCFAFDQHFTDKNYHLPV